MKSLRIFKKKLIYTKIVLTLNYYIIKIYPKPIENNYFLD